MFNGNVDICAVKCISRFPSHCSIIIILFLSVFLLRETEVVREGGREREAGLELTNPEIMT